MGFKDKLFKRGLSPKEQRQDREEDRKKSEVRRRLHLLQIEVDVMKRDYRK